MYTEGVPGARAAPGAGVRREEALSPRATGCLAKEASKMQPAFSALAAASALGINATKVRYQHGQYCAIFNATVIIINKIVNISRVPLYPSPKTGKTSANVGKKKKKRQHIQPKVKKRLHTISRAVFFLLQLYIFSMTN